jgi:glycosyltransferase involved in cell wall biosynthesis
LKQTKIVVFLPAHNEEQSIAEVIRKVPRTFHPNVKVEILVINDGSSDRTVEVALEAGADHIFTFEKNRGLGSAVRKGLEWCVQNGADIGVMIDADNEYPAEQIPDLVNPILAGEADYVMGSRFLGSIDGMKWNRRLGNYCFTFLQSLLLGRWIHDGQSGMRAFSKMAMEHAEIIHDYNYAQVVTLNLIRKGFRMTEVPIRYQVRSTGQSFIKFKSYMTSVLPAIVKEMRKPAIKVRNENKNQKLANQQKLEMKQR